MGTATPERLRLIQSQLETWAAPAFADGRYVAIVGRHSADIPAQLDSILMRSNCSDIGGAGVPCKEFELEREAHARQADWTVIVGEDNYVNTNLLETRLAEYDSQHEADDTLPVVLGVTNCLLTSCPELPNHLSLCGGGGAIMNRAALQTLFRDGAQSLQAEYFGMSGKAGGDAIMSCALQKRGGKLVEWRSNALILERLMQRQRLEYAISTKPAILHYMTTPAVMRWVHRTMHGKKADPEEAFSDDCCCWLHSKEECKRKQ
jgi:hypothetical protein